MDEKAHCNLRLVVVYSLGNGHQSSRRNESIWSVQV